MAKYNPRSPLPLIRANAPIFKIQFKYQLCGNRKKEQGGI
jgi:hypothetical protein